MAKTTKSQAPVLVALDDIVFDSETQPRVVIDNEKVDDYRSALEEGADFPPIILFYDGEHNWIGDGYHRALCYRAAGHKEVPAEVRKGGKREAILHAVGANATHGMPRTNADKRRAVMMLINDSEWSKWSDGLIAKQCAVTQPYVTKLRPIKEPTHNNYESRPRVGVNGRTMNTANIGKSRTTTHQPVHAPVVRDPSVYPAVVSPVLEKDVQSPTPMDVCILLTKMRWEFGQHLNKTSNRILSKAISMAHQIVDER